MLVGGGGYILAGYGWWWMKVGGSGWWWVAVGGGLVSSNPIKLRFEKRVHSNLFLRDSHIRCNSS